MGAEKRLRVGIVGAGANTRLRHLPGFQGIDGVSVEVVVNRSEASSRRVAEEFSIPRVAVDWRAVVADPEIDAICIGTWPNLHAEVTIAALEAGKHVLTEARMARNLAEAEAMAAASRRHPELVCQIVPAPMSLDVDAVAMGILKEGRLGTLRSVDLVHTQGHLLNPGAPLSWRQDYELSGRNILTMGIFYEILLRWIDRDPETVAAEGRIFQPERPNADGNPADVKIPDEISILGAYPGGAVFRGLFSGVDAGPGRNEIRLLGSDGALVFEPGAGVLSLFDREGEGGPVESPPEKRPGWRVEEDFVDSIRAKKPVRLTDFTTGLRYMAFTDAVWDSWSGGGEKTPVARIAV